jgi:D-alanyl-D-alanine carboxypeptidase/D-alanyl-D-alanine-endopeptidase (penicillin-binding protein 4)
LIVAGFLLLVLLAGALLAWRLPEDGRPDSPPTAVPGRPSPTSAPQSVASTADARRLAAALRGPLANPGFSGPPAVEVRDLRTGSLLFGRQQDVPQSPASTAKLLTAAVVLTELGPQTRLETRAFLAGGKIYLVGAGDPTLTAGAGGIVALPHGRLANPARIGDLARQIKSAGVTKADAVIGDAGLFTGPSLATGWPSYYLQSQVAPVSALTVDERRAPTPSLTATGALHDALTSSGVRAGAPKLGRVPPGARLVGHVYSPPLSALVEHMLTDSDNDMAEALGRLVALANGRNADFAGASAALITGLDRLGLPTTGVQMYDTSGLSPGDRVPPDLLVAVLRMADDPGHPELRPILSGLPVAGRTGTLATRYRSPTTRAGAGVVHAKSGRLLGVNSLAGVVRTRDGRQLVFALRSPTAGLAVGEEAMDGVATALARCGCR